MSISKECNRCPRAFEITHQLTGDTFENLISQICRCCFCLRKAKSNFRLKNSDHYVVGLLSLCELNRGPL